MNHRKLFGLTVGVILGTALLTACTAGAQESVTGATVQAPAAQQSTTVKRTVAKQSATNDTTEAAAKQAALAHAGYQESEVTKLRVKLDAKNQVYDVDFYVDQQEYEYEINALTAAVLSYDTEPDTTTGATVESDTQQQSTKPSVAESAALQTALTHAGLEQSAVSHAHTEREHGHYEVEFHGGHTEYSYDIDAASGQILSFEQDIDD